MQQIEIGTTFRSRTMIVDQDENGVGRITPAGSLGSITSVDDYPKQGLTYGCHFEATGATGYLLAHELHDPTQFEVLTTPI